jgi:class 3 adenylate cyclase
MGDPVNVAARLQDATKEHGIPILASDAIVRAAEEEGLWCEVVRVPLRGPWYPRHTAWRILASSRHSGCSRS